MRTFVQTTLVLLFAFGVSFDEPRIEREYLVKAGFLYNFAKFVRWPDTAFDSPDAPLSLCVIGDDPFGDDLNGLSSRKVRGREIAVARDIRTQEAVRCHVLFVSASLRGELEPVLDAVRSRHVLTVGDVSGFAQAGGMINLVTDEGRVRFEVNPTAADRAGLRISSDLLSLATIVDERNGEKEH